MYANLASGAHKWSQRDAPTPSNSEIINATPKRIVMAIDHTQAVLAKPSARKRKKNHSIRNKRRTKRGMVIDLDRIARAEIVHDRDADICQRCERWDGYPDWAVIQWAHVQSREYYVTRWEPDNSLALCSRCHVWFDNHKVLSFDWFAKKFPERWDRIKRILHAGTKTNDAWVRELWLARDASSL